MDLKWLALHELGHSLGLEHSSTKGAIMYPIYSGYHPGLELHRDDILGIQQLYGKFTLTCNFCPNLSFCWCYLLCCIHEDNSNDQARFIVDRLSPHFLLEEVNKGLLLTRRSDSYPSSYFKQTLRKNALISIVAVRHTTSFPGSLIFRSPGAGEAPDDKRPSERGRA